MLIVLSVLRVDCCKQYKCTQCCCIHFNFGMLMVVLLLLYAFTLIVGRLSCAVCVVAVVLYCLLLIVVCNNIVGEIGVAVAH